MRSKTAFFTILYIFFLVVVFLIPFNNIYSQEWSDSVIVTGQVKVDIYSTVDLNPVTVEIRQPSTVTVRILSPNGVGIAGRSVVIVAPGLIITQPTGVTDSQGRVTATVYSTSAGTYTVSAKDVTYGYDIVIQNSKTLYVVPVNAPTFSPEPYYTKGTSNTVIWNSIGSGNQYYVEVSEDPNFNTVLSNSGWINPTSYEATNLENGKMYFYRVKTRNPYGGESGWSTYVFSVQDNELPEIKVITIGDVGDNNTVVWDSKDSVEMIFTVTDNLQLESAVFLCVNSKDETYQCTTDYRMEGDNLIVSIPLNKLERISGAYLRVSYEFCVEATDSAGNIKRVCNIVLTIPSGQQPEEEEKEPSIVEIIQQGLIDIGSNIDKLVGNYDPNNLEALTTSTSIITVATAFILTFGSLINLPLVLFQLILNLLRWLGFRVGAKPLGYVYDALTKDPIPQAIVRIYDENGKMVWSDVTDGRGYFSAKLEDGKYRIVVRASDYTYPSTIIYGKDDYPLTNVYHGDFFEINQESIPNFSIPLDPKQVSSFRVLREIVWGRVKVLFSILHTLLFVVGLVLSIYMYVERPYWLTALVLFLYFLSFLFMIRKIFTRKIKYGVVRDVDSNPVEGVVIGLRDMEFEKLILKRVTDSNGRYRILAPSGRYRIEVLETGYKVESIEGDSEVVIEKREEWVKRDITVSKIERV